MNNLWKFAVQVAMPQHVLLGIVSGNHMVQADCPPPPPPHNHHQPPPTQQCHAIHVLLVEVYDWKYPRRVNFLSALCLQVSICEACPAGFSCTNSSLPPQPCDAGQYSLVAENNVSTYTNIILLCCIAY